MVAAYGIVTRVKMTTKTIGYLRPSASRIFRLITTPAKRERTRETKSTIKTETPYLFPRNKQQTRTIHKDLMHVDVEYKENIINDENV